MVHAPAAAVREPSSVPDLARLAAAFPADAAKINSKGFWFKSRRGSQCMRACRGLLQAWQRSWYAARTRHGHRALAPVGRSSRPLQPRGQARRVCSPRAERRSSSPKGAGVNQVGNARANRLGPINRTCPEHFGSSSLLADPL